MLGDTLARSLKAHQAGRLGEAESGYRSILKRDPRFLDALYLLGVLLHQTGRHQEALDLLTRAVARNAQRPEFHNALGDTHRVLGQFVEARASLEQALALRPDYPEAVQNLALTLNADGKKDEALILLFNAVATQPTVAPLRQLLATLLQGVSLQSGNVLVREVLRLLLSDAQVSAQALAGAVLGLCRHEAYFVALARAAEEGHDPFVVAPDALHALMQDALLGTALPQLIVQDVTVERVLTSVRAALVRRATEGAAGDAIVPPVMETFVHALAAQMYNSEYAAMADDDERARLERVQDTIERALTATDSSAGRVSDVTTLERSLALWALYAPLHRLTGWERLVEPDEARWSESFRLLVRTQVVEHQVELSFRRKFSDAPASTAATSRAVRAMYETNPYPRWVSVSQPTVTSVRDVVRELRPNQHVGQERPSILVAGCGTGQQVVQMARSFPEASVTAFDLSVASLAYAARMAEHYGVAERVEWLQADLLSFSAPSPYTMVTCSGVLHHLQDPLAGWRRVRDMVATDGVMKIGLYSTMARRAVTAAQAIAADFAPDDDGLRACRQAIMALPAEHAARGVLTIGDFFSLSGCRDLLKHVQEQTYTLPEIADSLTQLDLEFLGFQLPQPVQARFAAAYGADAVRDLGAWHLFEIDHPDTFSAMYQFWCCRR